MRAVTTSASLELDPEHPMAHQGLAYVLDELGDSESAATSPHLGFPRSRFGRARIAAKASPFAYCCCVRRSEEPFQPRSFSTSESFSRRRSSLSFSRRTSAAGASRRLQRDRRCGSLCGSARSRQRDSCANRRAARESIRITCLQPGDLQNADAVARPRGVVTPKMPSVLALGIERADSVRHIRSCCVRRGFTRAGFS